MDIYVLHDGKEIGPLTAEKTWLLLNQGSILADDLAWSPGMAKWEPLAGILPPVENLPAAPAPAAPVENFTLDPATAKQRALLAFLHIGFTRSTSKTEAALLISDALENPAFAVRLAQWPTERLKLHGDLFVAELQAKRENRAHHYLACAQGEGAALFTGVTRTHTQSIVTHLDLERPGWDASESTAAREFFFPALAEKFPQLVRPEAQGKLHLPAAPASASAPASEPARKKSRAHKPRAAFPLGALIRGLFFGALIVGITWFVMNVLQGGKSPAPAAATSSSTTEPAPTAAPAAPTPATPPETPPASTIAAPISTPEPAPPAPAATPAPMAENSPPPAPAATPAEPAPAPPEAPSAPATVLLTKPFEAKSPYGSMTLPAGTALRFLSQEGALLKVQHLNNVLLVPASATNYTAPPPPAPGL